VALQRLDGAACAEFGYQLAARCSPLRRGYERDERLQRGKEHNVALAASLLDRALVQPGQLCSYHHLVGRPSRLRGFREGLELHQERAAGGIGGGCCQVSNQLYLLCALAGMRIVERHRHGLDLFADCQRSVPFGCGATIFYNYADLRFENPLDQPVLLRVTVADGQLVGELRCQGDPGFRAEIREEGHRFFRRDGGWWRENRIHRRIVAANGETLLDHQLAHNLARVLYEPDSQRGSATC